MATGRLPEAEAHPVKGVRLAAVKAGIRYSDRYDLVLLELAQGSTVAGVFTRNAFCAAPVLVAREHLQSSGGASRYFLINAGNANAGTGKAGLEDARRCCAQLAETAAVDVTSVLPFSTGVIGERLPVDRLIAGLQSAVAELDEGNWQLAARGIMTTDTRPKMQSRRLEIDGSTVTITGICKGAGMIRPDMATMLAYVCTDAAISRDDLQELLASAVEQSFNRITVDGDTSTNDCCMLAATGGAGVTLSSENSDTWHIFTEAVQDVLRELAIEIIRDAEGASKFVTVDVQQGADSTECLKVAYTVAESPLVKTALTASDPNWGRILAAVGRAGIDSLDVDRVTILLDDVCIVDGGMVADDYREEAGQAVMNREDITITVKLDRGQARETVWTSDLSEEYVRINASYRS